MITLQVREPTPTGAEDEFGNSIPSWATRTWEVRSIAPGAMQEPDTTSRDLSLVVWTVYADKGGEPTEHGQVSLPGDPQWYTVEGRPADWTMGPPRLGPHSGPLQHNGPGVVVELRRADG